MRHRFSSVMALRLNNGGFFCAIVKNILTCIKFRPEKDRCRSLRLRYADGLPEDAGRRDLRPNRKMIEYSDIDVRVSSSEKLTGGGISFIVNELLAGLSAPVECVDRCRCKYSAKYSSPIDFSPYGPKYVIAPCGGGYFLNNQIVIDSVPAESIPDTTYFSSLLRVGFRAGADRRVFSSAVAERSFPATAFSCLHPIN